MCGNQICNGEGKSGVFSALCNGITITSSLLKVLAEIHRNGGCSEDDAPRVLDLLLATIPDYLLKTQPVDGRGPMIRISRNMDSNTARLRVHNVSTGQLENKP